MYTANVLTIKTMGTGNCRVPAGKICTIYEKRAVRISGKPHNNEGTCNNHGVSPQFLQPFSVDGAHFPCRDPAISSPHSFYGQNICSVSFFCLLLNYACNVMVSAYIVVFPDSKTV